MINSLRYSKMTLPRQVSHMDVLLAMTSSSCHKERTQEEFFHTLTLHECMRRCARSDPRQGMAEIEDACDRFEWGLMPTSAA